MLHHHTPLIPISTKPVNSDKRRNKIMKTKQTDYSQYQYVRDTTMAVPTWRLKKIII